MDMHQPLAHPATDGGPSHSKMLLWRGSKHPCQLSQSWDRSKSMGWPYMFRKEEGPSPSTLGPCGSFSACASCAWRRRKR